jgi:serine/threonine-protein kinase RsbW
MVASEVPGCSTFESRVESVEVVEELVRRFSHDAGFGEDDEYFIGLAAREIVINAIKHGNRLDPNKKVGVRLSKNARSITIEVSDEGDGFRLENVPDPRAAENQERRSGRGLAITLAIMDEFFVDRNVPRGTHIRMVKTLPSPQNQRAPG